MIAPKLWNSEEDIFLFKVHFDFRTELTKRIFISQFSKVFDPLGLFSPCTITLKDIISTVVVAEIRLGYSTFHKIGKQIASIVIVIKRTSI